MVQAITTIEGIPAIPAIIVDDKNLQGMLDALKESVEVLTGTRGDPNSRALTYGEATEGGTTDLFVTNRVVETAQGSQNLVTLEGDITGLGIFTTDGNVTVSTAINLPNVVCIDGGTASETFPGAVTGPYGVAAGSGTFLPDGGTANQILIKQSATDGDAVWDDWSSAAGTGEYCPGFTYVYVSATAWKIQGVDQTKLFRIGRRLHFIEGASNYYGTITNSTFNAGDTNLTMDMDTGSLTAGVTEVCLTTGAGGVWSTINEDPFTSTQINGIETGQIGATQWWVIIGNSGKLATSTDAGITWTLRTLTTTEHLNVITFDFTNERFWVGGDAGVLVDSSNGTTWSEDTTSIPGLGGTGDDRINGILWNSTNAAVEIWYKDTTVNYRSAYTTDFSTWADIATLGQLGHNNCMFPVRNSAGDVSGTSKYSSVLNGTYLYTTSSPTDASWAQSHNAGTGNIISAVYNFHDGAGTVMVLGCFNGTIHTFTTWTGDQTNGLFSDQHNAIAWSPTLERLVSVGDNAQIGYMDRSDSASNNKWVSVAGGIAPTADILDVAWNDTDGVYICVADNGQIARSTSGLGASTAPITHSGWTEIAGDPFSGGQINAVVSGAIGGTIWWVAVGNGGKLFTSTDKGATWTSRSSGTTNHLLVVSYNVTDEQFVVGATGGEFLDSTNGTTWALDNTTIAALGHTGTDDINGVIWSPTDALWHWIIFSSTGNTMRTYTTTNALTTFTSRDTNVIATVGAPSRIQVGSNFIVWPSTEDANYHVSATDTTDTAYASYADPSDITASGFAAGTGSFTHDYTLGKRDGNIHRHGSTTGGSTVRYSQKPHSNAWRAMDVSTIGTKRWIAVGDNNEMWTVQTLDYEGGLWEEVTNPFTAHILDVHYNATDAYWVAVGNNGQICRSVDGIS